MGLLIIGDVKGVSIIGVISIKKRLMSIFGCLYHLGCLSKGLSIKGVVNCRGYNKGTF